MTAVDTRTGEVMQAMSRAEAEEFVGFILTAQEELPRRIVDAYQRRVWLALGYASWDDMCTGEGIQLRFPREERQQIVLELRAGGLSTRAIGSALGVDQSTVVRDLPTDANASVDQPETITSLDGRQRPSTQPPRARPSADVADASVVEEPQGSGGETASSVSDDVEHLPPYDPEVRARLEAEAARESELRAARNNLRSVLTYLTSTSIPPERLAKQDYGDVIHEFDPVALNFAARTMAAVADMRGTKL